MYYFLVTFYDFKTYSNYSYLLLFLVDSILIHIINEITSLNLFYVHIILIALFLKT